MSFICDTNATTKEHVQAMVYLLLSLWFFVTLCDHSVLLCNHFTCCQVSKMTVLIFIKETLS